jgi:DNA-binding IclR family transcriptional regulator
MTDEQMRIVAYLERTGIAATAQEIANEAGCSRGRALDLLRDLEDLGKIRGGESGFYRLPRPRPRVA